MGGCGLFLIFFSATDNVMGLTNNILKLLLKWRSCNPLLPLKMEWGGGGLKLPVATPNARLKKILFLYFAVTIFGNVMIHESL